ncbi:4277_t:CDS:10 [Ambispora leptoticha]|uniref:4277_t:CDS:1 n=1 Tax=Ambispora leptoticha TaxID=144679 RepID=A0A9N9EZ39_9GLOM|nr:4277_t:CDS:10 [Ambispora leptoticha]
MEYLTGDNTEDAAYNEITLTTGVKAMEQDEDLKTPAYDALKDLLNAQQQTDPPSDAPSVSSVIEHDREEATAELSTNEEDDAMNYQNSLLQRILPIQIDCEHGAIIAGNENVPSILVAEFVQASGIYAAVRSRSRLDLYKSVFRIKFRNPKIHLKTNLDYQEPLLTRAARLKQGEQEADNPPTVPIPDAADEYAKDPIILDCVELDMNYYADVAGKVPRVSMPIDITEELEIGNGDLSPEWGVDLFVSGGTVRYGPWADRQRVLLQNFFFPPLYRSSIKTKPLEYGQDRLHTMLKLLIQFDTDTILRIPTRETSKDWSFAKDDDNEDDAQPADNSREAGWLEVTVGKSSMIKLSLPMILDENGYTNKVDIRFNKITVQTSVNYANLLTAENCKIKCDLQNPLIWNQARQWIFNIDLDKPKIFLLRDHITLFQDLAKDWTSGPSVDLLHFIPMEYIIEIESKDIELYLCVNEHNIIEDPADIDDNAFFIISSKQLTSTVVLPFLKFEQEITKIPFNVKIVPGLVSMSPPTSQSLGAFLAEDGKVFLNLDNFNIEGNYQYYSFVEPNHIESLSMKMFLKKANLKLFGFVVRYVLKLQENYFGNFVNFTTLEEYRLRRDGNGKNTQLELDQRRLAAKPPADPFEVYIQLFVEDGTICLPENLYTSDNVSTIQFHELQLDLRNTDPYMDMDLTLSPLTWTLSSDPSIRRNTMKSKPLRESYLFIDELNIYAHRLFGPLPVLATYVCNWDINIGTISGQLKPSFLLSVISFGKSFAYHLVDEENAFPTQYLMKLDPDVTFLNVGVKEIDISVWGQDSGTQFLLKEGLHVQFDDLSNEKFTQKVVFNMPDLVIRKDYPWVEVASFECAFDVTLYRTTSGWQKRVQEQQSFLKEQDQETLRVPFLYGGSTGNGEGASVHSNAHHLGTLYVPPMPTPVHGNIDASPLWDTESTHSSIINNNNGAAVFHDRENMRVLGKSYELLGRNEDFDEEQENDDGWWHVDDDNASILTGISVSNSSFVTASDRDPDEFDLESENSVDSDETFIDDIRNVEINIGRDSDDEGSQKRSDSSLTETSGAYRISPSIPRSIPYGSCLRRYRINSQKYFTNFSSSYLRPSRATFVPAQETELLSTDEENSQSFKSSPFSKNKGAATDESLEETLTDAIMTPTLTSENNETKMTIVFESTKSVKILLTPIFLKIIQEILEAVKSEHWNLESMLDYIQIDYVGDLTKLFPFKYTTTKFAVSIPRVTLHFIQDVLLPDDLTNVSDEYSSIRTRYDLTDTVLCAADIVLEQSLITGLVKFEDTNFHVKDKNENFEHTFKLVESRVCLDFETLKLNVHFVAGSNPIGIFGIPKALHHFKDYSFSSGPVPNEPVVLDIFLEHVKVKLMSSTQPTHFSLDMGSFNTIFISQSIEILTGAIYSWLLFADDLSIILNSFQNRRKRQLQTLIYEIALFSDVHPIANDPPYLTRSSIVLRLGATNFKNDDGWKILVRIRYCKRFMLKESLEQLQAKLTSSDLSTVDPTRMFNKVQEVFSKWRHWELGNLSNSRLFTKLFEQCVGNEGKGTSDMLTEIQQFLISSSRFVRIRIGLIGVSNLEGQCQNSVVIGPIEVDLESHYRADGIPPSELYQANNSDSRKNNENITVGQNMFPAGYLNVIFRFSSKKIDVDVNPEMLAFAKHCLKVQRVFTSKFKYLSQRNKSNVPVCVEPGNVSSLGHKSTSTITTIRDIKNQKTTTAKDKKQHKDSLPQQIPEFNLKNLLSRIEIVAHGIFTLQTIVVKASPQNLLAHAQLSNFNVTSLFYNPRTIYIMEKAELENASLNRSSIHPGSRGSGGRSSNKLILSTVGGIENITMSIKEQLYSSSSSFNTLISVEFSGIGTNVALMRQYSSQLIQKNDPERESLNIFVKFQTISVRAPQSLLKLYTFVEKWREENLPSYDFLFKRLMDEWEEQRKATTTHSQKQSHHHSSVSKKNAMEMKFQFLLKKFSFQSHLLPSLQFHYDASNLFFLIHQKPTLHEMIHMDYSGQLTKQEVGFVTRHRHKNKSSVETPVVDGSNEDQQQAAFTIPAIRTTGMIRPYEQRKSGMSKKAIPSSKYSKLEALITLDLVKLKLNVNIIDNLFTAQSLLGNELNDVLDVFAFSSKRFKERGNASRNASLSSANSSTSKMGQPSSVSSNNLLYSIKISLNGLRISASSPNAIGFFETNILNGFITNVHSVDIKKPAKVAWKFSAQNLSLSLNHNTGSNLVDDNVRKFRIAYILIDLVLQNCKNKYEDSEEISSSSEEKDSTESFFLTLSKVHAVMQPIALGRLMDLYVYYSGELERRKELKASEINQLANNTREILRSLDVQIPKYKTKSKSLLDEKVLSLQINRFAVALPLDLREEGISAAAHRAGGTQIPAFLLSTTSMKFITQKWKSTSASLKELCFQFVTQFDQGNEEHFSAHSHPKMNRIHYPEISCNVRALGNKDKKQIFIDSRVEGFEVDIAGNIVNHINSLGEIYAASRERLEAFTAEANLGSQSQPKGKAKTTTKSDSEENAQSNLIELEIKACFTVKSGILKLYPKKYFTRQQSLKTNKSTEKPKSSRSRSISTQLPPRLNLDSLSSYSASSDELSKQAEHGIDKIVIPGLSLNTTYQTVIGQIPGSLPDASRRRLHVELVIHPSENTLYPSLVPFIKDIIDGLKLGIQKKSDKKAIAIQESSPPIYGMNITCYFRLSRTTFELSCRPTSKVLCSLNWEEGNFLVVSDSGDVNVQSITCIGKIRGASGNIRHAFSPEDCLRGETKDMSFNATLMSRRTDTVSDDSISIIVDFPQITADLNIRHLQDLLLLKAIWLDQATKLYEETVQYESSKPISQDISEIKEQSSHTYEDSESNAAKAKPYSVYILLRLKQLDLSSDLGQAIGRVQFNTQNIRVRTKRVPGVLRKVIISTDLLDIQSEGRLRGTATMTGLNFSTWLCVAPTYPAIDGASVTKILFKTEQIKSSLEYEYQKILILEVDPMELKITDQWSNVTSEKAQVLIHADIILRRIQAIVAVKTIPIFIHMSDKLLALIEEKRLLAANVISESNTTEPTKSNQTLPLKPVFSPATNEDSDSPISESNENETRITFQELKIGGMLVHPVGKITIALELAHLIVFPNHFYDSDCVQAKSDVLKIDMKCSADSEKRMFRELILHLDGISLSKNSCKKLSHKDEKELKSHQWFDHVNSSSSKKIFTLPRTNLTMTTSQAENSNIIDHKFATDFGGKVDVALNFGLIRYLQELVVLYKEQLKKHSIGIGENPKSPVSGTPSTRSTVSSATSTSPTKQGSSPILRKTNDDLTTLTTSKSNISDESTAATTSSSALEQKQPTFQYNPLEPVKLEPQLRIMGDATPPLEWVGVQRAKIPGFVHTMVMMNLDEVLTLVYDIYAKELQDLRAKMNSI